MSLYGILFYLLAILLIVSTAMAVSRTRLVHAVVYLVVSFLSTALLFYLLGAPFIAALEVIIYAGAIMVMFLFMIMTLRMEETQKRRAAPFRPWVPAVVLSAFALVLLAALLWVGPGHGLPLKPAMASPLEFGVYLFREFWFPVELASFLLFVALAGALYLGREKRKGKQDNPSAEEAS
jgi:NADH-quinone oxidoreductase subunit J